MKHPVSISLAALLLAAAFTACGAESIQTPENIESAVTAANTEAVTEEEVTVSYESDSLPAELNFGGEEVTIYGWSGPDVVEFYAEQDGDIINDAIYNRNRTVEERLSVKLNFILELGNYNNKENWVKLIKQSIMAGDGAYDIAAGYSMCGATLAYDRLVMDLNGMEYLDFSKPWWPASLMEEALCMDHLYFCSGDISSYMIMYLYATFFNKNLLSQYDLEEPYQLVRDGKWTMDAMKTMIAGVYKDLDGDGRESDGDQYGLLTHPTYTDAYYFSCGLHVTERDADGIPVLSTDFIGEKGGSLLLELIDLFDSPDAMNISDYDIIENTFASGRAMFDTTEVKTSITKFRGVGFDFGVVPVPKYDESQKEYRTLSSFPYSLYCIPVDAKDANKSAAVLECMASEGYRQVSPALFETALKVKYASDTDISEMYDIIRSTNVFDFGRIFNDSINGMTYSLFRSALNEHNENWASIIKSNEKALNKYLAKVVKALTEEQ